MHRQLKKSIMAFPFIRWHSKLDFHLRCYQFSSKQISHLTKEAGNRVMLPVNCLRAISDRLNDLLVSSTNNNPLLFKIINPVLQYQHTTRGQRRPAAFGTSNNNTSKSNDADDNNSSKMEVCDADSSKTSTSSQAAVPQYETHCGVYEFTADDAQVYLPDWMLSALSLTDGASVTIELVERIPKGQFVRLQPLADDFFTRVSNPKVLLEFFLRHFVCLTKNEIITINYLSNDFKIRISEAKPADVVCIVDCDVEVDFEEPPNSRGTAASSDAFNANLHAFNSEHHHQQQQQQEKATGLTFSSDAVVPVSLTSISSQKEQILVPVLSLPESMRKIVLEEGRKFAGSGQKLQAKKTSSKKKRKTSSTSDKTVEAVVPSDRSPSTPNNNNHFYITSDDKVDIIAAGFRGVPDYSWSPLRGRINFRRRRRAATEKPTTTTADNNNSHASFSGAGNVLGRISVTNDSEVSCKIDAENPAKLKPSADDNSSFADLNSSDSNAPSSSSSLHTWHSAISTHFGSNTNGSGSSDNEDSKMD